VNYAKLEKWQKFAKAHHHSMEELALAWLLSHPYVSSVIAGATKPEQVTSHVAAAEWKISAQELTELEKLTIG
jgi:aryl-alcohol dehydrogenase-like predicted oxidoreductase